jgi:hydrazine synthase alpha subunit-like protein
MLSSPRIAGIALVATLVSLYVGGHAGLVGCNSDSTDEEVAGVNAIVFVKRQHTTVGSGGPTVNVAGGNGQVLDYERYVPGGQLVILSPPRPDGVLKIITAEFPEADFNGVDVSFDAKQAVFSMKRDGQDHYHLYTAQLDEGADGKFEIHQKTGGNHDDINPVYVPGGRIAFVTNEMYTAMGTRSDEYNHGRGVTQLATISVEGGDADRRLASQNLSHTVAPFVRFDGKIAYSRWEHLGGVNDVKIFAANPDGTQMVAVAGQHAKPSNSLFSLRELEPNVMIGIATDRERTIHAGALVKIDARNKADPVCMDPQILDKQGRPCLDEENVGYEILTPDVPTGSGPSPVGRYREPSKLPDGRILVSWADGPVNDLSEQSITPPDFGVYIYDPATRKNQLIYNDRATWELNAVAVAPRQEPPVIGDAVSRNVDPGTSVRIGSVDIARTSLTDTVKGAQFGDKGVPIAEALRQTAKVRIIEGFSSEAAPKVTMFGLTMDEGAAILGEADVYADGSWLAEIPPYVPVHVQPIDKYGLSIRNQRLWIQGMPGEDRRCVGCHEQRSGAGAPRLGANPTIAEQRQAQKFVQPIGERLELPWALKKADYPDAKPTVVVQDILDKKCVQCHSGGQGDPFAGKVYTFTATNPATGAPQTYSVPYLDLSSAEIDVVYDRMNARYPKSYVSLFYPATMEMGMGNAQRTGDLPPKWAIPNNARESALVRKLNVKAADGSFAFGTPAMHPEDKGVELTAEERQHIIRSIDVGGQFYARQNTGFVPFAQDPVAPGQRY